MVYDRPLIKRETNFRHLLFFRNCSGNNRVDTWHCTNIPRNPDAAFNWDTSASRCIRNRRGGVRVQNWLVNLFAKRQSINNVRFLASFLTSLRTPSNFLTASLLCISSCYFFFKELKLQREIFFSLYLNLQFHTMIPILINQSKEEIVPKSRTGIKWGEQAKYR